jgi:hypothetical protein
MSRGCFRTTKLRAQGRIRVWTTDLNSGFIALQQFVETIKEALILLLHPSHDFLLGVEIRLGLLYLRSSDVIEREEALLCFLEEQTLKCSQSMENNRVIGALSMAT